MVGREGFGRRHVDHDDLAQAVPIAEVRDVGGHQVDLLLLGGGARRDGPQVLLGGAQALAHGVDEGRGEHAARGELLGALLEGGRGDVVTADDDLVDGGELLDAHRIGLGGEADRRGGSEGERVDADGRRRGERPAGADEPGSDVGGGGGVRGVHAGIRSSLRDEPSGRAPSIGRSGRGRARCRGMAGGSGCFGTGLVVEVFQCS
ncbi:hypothetical protein QE410_000382 [Microbacterium sp. SORGH_AS 1204]|uniref:hypothetical protein n=1 Tax=Microbacterium sp. SORGH_AS_1204 TaxID=3041785 RepID=UPI00278F0DFF|nr:hypothetical protein [Microbacterium sp. SORGH_AS_1204]MDQ1135583.1 hypothetical protein [Microbacterium sp. SORGH_AS_1204]